MKTSIKIAILLAFSIFQLGCHSELSTSHQTEKPFTVFLVRHAEKANLTKDPELSAEGKKRSLELAEVLRSTNIAHVHSSDYIRTRETAAPTSKQFGLTTEIYNPRALEELADKIKKEGGVHLVVGHSNTTPKMVELLGGNPDSEINEKGEFDRLYIISSHVENVSSILLRYGQPYIVDVESL